MIFHRKHYYLSLLFLYSSLQTYYLEFAYPQEENLSLKADFLYYLSSICKTSVFIETQALHGKTTQNALKYFDEIYSIEQSPELCTELKSKFEDVPHVTILEGTANIILSEFLRTFDTNKRILFWLDHNIENENSSKDAFSILEELKTIELSGINNSIVLVNNIHLFFEETTGHPTLQSIKNHIININPKYILYVYGNILLAVLSTDNIQVSPLIQLFTQLYAKCPTSIPEKKGIEELQSKFGLFPSIQKYIF